MESPQLVVLPRHGNLSTNQLGFLEEHFTTYDDLSGATRVLSELSEDCSNSDADLLSLHRDVIRRSVSWISHSFGAKTSLKNLSVQLEDLSLYTSQYGISKDIQKIIVEELPQLGRELKGIEDIRKYVDTALKLEALVGNLEDAVLCTVNNHIGSMFSAKLSISPVSTDFVPKQERVLNAIKTINDIEDIMLDVAKLQPQWRRLLECVDARVDNTLSFLRPQVLAEHRALLASLGWPPKLLPSSIENGEISGIPNPLVLMQGNKRKSYSQSFLVLCALQHLQTRRETRQLNSSVNQKATGLWAIDELVSPIASRMEYHFVKWSEQPEFIFTLVHKFTSDFVLGVDDVLQPLIDRARLASCSAREAWVSAMVQVVYGYLAKRTFPALAERYKEKNEKPEVISLWLHLVDLIVAFDKQMQSLVSSETCLHWMDSEAFKGLSIMMIFCDRTEWLKMWARMELKDACKELKAELKDERAWKIDNGHKVEFLRGTDSGQFLLSTREAHKAPLVAESVVQITEKMIERCMTMPTIMPRIQFLRSTASKFLWYFFNALLLRCKKIEFSLDDFDGSGLIRLCQSINSARYVESKLQEWNDEVNFLEMRIAESNSKFDKKGEDLSGISFFDEEVKSLVELETIWLMEIITYLLRQFETSSLEYFQSNKLFEDENFTSSKASVPTTDLAMSTGFVEALDTLRSQLQILKTSLNSKDFLDLWRSIAEGLDHFISRSIIIASDIRFSSTRISQLGVDLRMIFLVFQPFCARPEAFFPCVRETIKLMEISKEEVKQLRVAFSDDKNRMNCLVFFGISHLSVELIDKILKHRKFGA